jgi:putative membrane protein
LDAIVKPILVLLTLPVTVVTLGLFLFAINAIVILLASRLISGIRIDGFWWAMLFSIILSIFDTAIQKSVDKRNA